MNNIVWEISSFDALDIYTLYNILRLRCQTFVVEQKGIYQDLDEKDFAAIHLQGYIDKKLVAYCRIFKRVTISPRLPSGALLYLLNSGKRDMDTYLLIKP